MSDTKLSSGPACEKGNLLIEVTGKEHDPASYSIHFHEKVSTTFYYMEEGDTIADLAKANGLTQAQLLADNPRVKNGESRFLDIPHPTTKKDGLLFGPALDDLNGQEKTESLVTTSLYKWEWGRPINPVNSYLNIATDGDPITLPLFNDIALRKRMEYEQDYLLHAFVPLTRLPTFDNKKTDQVAPARNGYLYIFYNDKIWREIEIHSAINSAPYFQDVNLASYRDAETAQFSSDKRDATSKPLKDIWLPVKYTDRVGRSKFCEIGIAYSEVAWSGQRINYLEANPAEMYQRTQSLDDLRFTSSYIINNPSERYCLPTSTLEDMRVREPETELTLAAPAEYSSDLSGSWLNKQYNLIKGKIEKVNKGGGIQLGSLRSHSKDQYEYAMKQDILHEMVSQRTNAEKKNWTADTSLNYLEDAKNRYLRGIIVEDPLFNLRHHAFITQYAIGYMQQVYVDMSQQEHYQSAELVQEMVMRKKFGKQENPYYEFRDEVNNYINGDYHRTLRTNERELANRDIKELQDYVVRVLGEKRTAQALRDITSLNDANAAAAYMIVGYGISVLSSDIDKLDPFSQHDRVRYHENKYEIQNVKERAGRLSQRVKSNLESVFTSPSHPLNKVLFPKGSEEILSEDFEFPDPFNDGSGLATPANLVHWSRNGLSLKEADLEVIDAAFLVDNGDNGATFLMDNGDISTAAFGLIRRVVNNVNSIYEAYFKALTSLKDAIDTENKVPNFNKIYTLLLSNLKLTEFQHFGKIIYTAVDGSEAKGIVLGVHTPELKYGLSIDDREYLEQKNKKGLSATVKTEDGKLLVSTKKQAAKSSPEALANLGKKSAAKVLVLPNDSELAEVFSQKNTKRALRDLDDPDLNSSNAYDRFKMPYVILTIELINVMQNKHHFENVFEYKDMAYPSTNVGSVIADLGVATIHAAKLNSRLATLAVVQWWGDDAITIGANAAIRKFTDIGYAKLVGSISWLGLAGIGAGLLTAATLGWDAIRLSQVHDDDASAAMWMAAIGTGLTTIATGLFQTTPILFGMGPVALLGVGIAIAGFALYMVFKDTPMETWLKNGPFAEEEPASKFAHLQEPQEAFKRLVGILFKLDVTAYPFALGTRFETAFKQALLADGVTHVIEANCNLAALLNPNQVTLDFHARPAIQKTTEKRSRTGTTYSYKAYVDSSKDTPIVHSTYLANRYFFFIKRPKIVLPKDYLDADFLDFTPEIFTHQKAIMTRLRLMMGNDIVFPGLPLDEAEPDEDVKTTPNFTEKDDYWYPSTLVDK